MAVPSAPLLDTLGTVGPPPPPSYEDTIGTKPPYYPPQGFPPAPFQPPYSSQPQTQMYQGPPPPQLQPVTHPMAPVQLVHMVPGRVFTTVPAQTFCPMCQQNVVTRLEHSSGACVWLSCVGVAVVGCFYGCCLIPFCVDSLKDVIHHCPECSSILGVYKRI